MAEQDNQKTPDPQASHQPQVGAAAPPENDAAQAAQPGEPAQPDVAVPEPDEAAACTSSADAPATVEAILFSADKPLPAAKISEIAELGGARVVRETIKLLNDRYEQVGSSFRIREIAGGFQMQTLPEYGDVLARLMKNRAESKLSQAALEALAIVAYRQPVLRADIESIRGVACGEVLRTLMERNLVRIAGRADEIGRPMLYGTTRHFLEVFGLAGLEDLPNAEQLRRPEEKKAPSPGQPAAGAPAAETAASATAADAPKAAADTAEEGRGP